MHARIAAFENRDVRGSDDLIGLVGSRAAESDVVPAIERHLLLLGPTNGGALTLTLVDGADALQLASAVLDALECEIPEVVRGRRTSVRAWEVAVDELQDGARAARSAVLAAPFWRAADVAYLVREQLATEADELDGWRGALVLVDPETGETRTITFWESDDALRRSEIRETQLRIRTAAGAGASVGRVDRYAVALDVVPAAV